jgi:hypothetical protein
MRRHVLIVCTDTRVEPERLAGALRDAVARVPRDEVAVVRVLLPAVLPPTLPISAWPPRLAVRVEALRAAADQAGSSLSPPARVEVAPCRSVPALLNAHWPVDALVLVGSAGWSVRRAARGVAADITILPSRPTGLRRRSATTAPAKALPE